MMDISKSRSNIFKVCDQKIGLCIQSYKGTTANNKTEW